MRHTFKCPVRWADMDLLGHVNNVTFVDYLQEARIDFFRAHQGFEGRLSRDEAVLVVRTEVDFLVPLVYRGGAVYVDIWVTQVRRASFTMAYEVWSPGRDDTDVRVVHVHASTVLAPYVFGAERPRRLRDDEVAFLEQFLEETPPRRTHRDHASSRGVYQCAVRFTDLDIFGHVNNVKFFELFQEARIAYLAALKPQGQSWGRVVVARSDVDYRRQLDLRPEPYEVHSWVAEVGERSYTLAAELRDGADVIATNRVVMVSFDPETQRSAPMSESLRALLVAEVEAAHADN